MVGVIGGFEDIIERGQTSAKKAGKQAVSDFGKTAKNQIVGGNNQSQVPGSNSKNDSGTNEQAAASQNQMSDDQAKQFLRDLYGPSKQVSNSQKGNKPAGMGQTPLQQALGMSPKDPNAGKTPEEIAKIESLRKSLHGQYYEELTKPKKPKEEHVTEKIEREEQEEKLSELETQKKKPPPLPITIKRGTGENAVGVSG